MKTILFDANFLLLPGTMHVDIYSQAEEIVPLSSFATIDKVVEELINISKTADKGSDKAAAKLGLQLLENKGVRIIKTETLKNTDDIIVDTALSGEFVVATQDKALKNKLKALGVPIIVLRQKKRLILE